MNLIYVIEFFFGIFISDSYSIFFYVLKINVCFFYNVFVVFKENGFVVDSFLIFKDDGINDYIYGLRGCKFKFKNVVLVCILGVVWECLCLSCFILGVNF